MRIMLFHRYAFSCAAALLLLLVFHANTARADTALATMPDEATPAVTNVDVVVEEDAPDDERSTMTAADDSSDLPMLAVYAGIALAATVIPGVGIAAPLIQGLVAYFAGPQLTKRSYPNWWVGTLAGYGVYAVGAAVTLGAAYGAGVALNNAGNKDIATAILTGWAIGITGSAVTFLIAEPIVAWLLGSMGSEPVGSKLVWHEEDADAGASAWAGFGVGIPPGYEVPGTPGIVGMASLR